MKKAQAALEFLMTYGWAILVILVVIGALTYFGVLNPSILLPEKCTFQLGMNCKDHIIEANENAIFLKLENGIGSGMIIKDINITGDIMTTCHINTSYKPFSETFGVIKGLHIQVGETVDIIVHCVDIQRISGKTKGQIVMSWLYDDSEEIFTRTMRGEVLAATETSREEKCCCDFQGIALSYDSWIRISECETVSSCTGDDFFACATNQEICCREDTQDFYFWMSSDTCDTIPGLSAAADSNCEY